MDIIACDLCDPVAVSLTTIPHSQLMEHLVKTLQITQALEEYSRVPDILFCVAGGTSPAQIGFLADLSPEGITSCLEINYYSSVFITQRCMQLWIKHPKPDRTRHIVFISSAAAFVGVPGYIAYTPAKAAVRALADTLRQELLLYGGTDMYQVHCAFPGTFITESFLAEQANKPELTKIMEGSNFDEQKILEKTPSATTIVQKILRSLEKGHYFITSDWESALILNNMRGPSPRDNVILDVLLQIVIFIAWPFIRMGFDRTTRNFGRNQNSRLA